MSIILNHHRIIIVYSNNDVNIAIDLYLQYYVARKSEAALIAMLKIGHLQVLKWFSQSPVPSNNSNNPKHRYHPLRLFQKIWPRIRKKMHQREVIHDNDTY